MSSPQSLPSCTSRHITDPEDERIVHRSDGRSIQSPHVMDIIKTPHFVRTKGNPHLERLSTYVKKGKPSRHDIFTRAINCPIDETE